MSSTAEVRFAVRGGQVAGLGHVVRCAALANEARKRGIAVAFSLDGDELASQTLEAALPGVRVEPWPVDSPPSGVEAVIFDTRGPLREILRTLHAESRSVIVLDRVDVLDEADLTVLPILHPPDVTHDRLVGGARYCILADAIRSVPAPPYPGERNIALVTLGGADPHGVSTAVCLALAAILEAAFQPDDVPEIHCILGAHESDPGESQRQLEKARIVVHDFLPPPGLRTLLERSLFAVAGLGAGVPALAYLGVPSLLLSQHREDYAAGTRLEAQGASVFGGFAGSFDAECFGNLAQRSVLDSGWCRGASERGRALLGDGAGASRVLDAILSVLGKESGCRV